MPTPLVDIVTIGTELTRGEIADTNAAWLGRELHRHGFSVGTLTSVPDDRQAIERALGESAARAQAVLVSGGLGPTVDDFTAEVAATVCGVHLQRDAEALQRLHARLAGFGLPVTPNNEKQADVPAGARVLQNDAGTAPGFVTPPAPGRAPMWFLPGVPRELERMFARQVLPDLAARWPERDHVAERRIRCFGTGESTVDFMLKKQIEQLAGAGVEIAFRASWPEIIVTFRARAEIPDVAEAQVDRAVREARATLEDIVYGEGDAPLARVVGEALVARGLTIAVAESCTAGMLGELLTEPPGASAWLKGGVIVYSNDAKTSLLGVEPELLAAHGAVSEPVARKMAEEAADRLGAQVGVAITGIAGPDGGTVDKPVGTVHVAVAMRFPSRTTLHASRRMRGDRNMIRRIACFAALRLVLRALEGKLA